ncbi:MAG: hypothetical protein PF693_10835 [Spirochaetia bacterium]|jgi:ElaB/YqjD/DUF883 family membrane-anchored ribosome-binding protein|nr:hypothetical protein [Spirochaetia bacterium]
MKKMNQKEENLEALTHLVNKLDTVQTEIESLLPLMDFDNSDKEIEAAKNISDIIDRFSEVFKNNRDKFVLKIISIIEAME